MTEQQTNPQQRPQFREDYKAKKLLERIEAKLRAEENRAQTSSTEK